VLPDEPIRVPKSRSTHKAAVSNHERRRAKFGEAGGESAARAPVCGMDSLEELAEALRRRLIARAREGATAGGALAVEVRALVDAEAPALPDAEREDLAARVVRLATGLGPLEPLLADPRVDEVMVNGPGEVWVERGGRLERAVGVRFEGEAALMHSIERILAPLGRRVDEAAPICDARLADGSRVNVVIPPLSLGGPCLTIRRFRRHGFSLEELVEGGTLAPPLASFLAGCVRARASILVSGGTGSGKTTTLGALSAAIPDGERIVTIEDAAELRLRQRHVVRLESRPANLEGRGEVTIRALVRNALRMRPDRIVVGEVRGGEALDMLAALNTGHEGSLTTVHANSPEDALRRVETLALMAGVGLPHDAVREQVASALQLVVHQTRAPTGERRVESVAEVVRVAGGAATRDLYRLRDGRPWWRPPAAGALAERLERAGVPSGGAGAVPGAAGAASPGAVAP
jgi:pilus assembly protein CpaF